MDVFNFEGKSISMLELASLFDESLLPEEIFEGILLYHFISKRKDGLFIDLIFTDHETIASIIIRREQIIILQIDYKECKAIKLIDSKNKILQIISNSLSQSSETFIFLQDEPIIKFFDS